MLGIGDGCRAVLDVLAGGAWGELLDHRRAPFPVPVWDGVLEGGMLCVDGLYHGPFMAGLCFSR